MKHRIASVVLGLDTVSLYCSSSWTTTTAPCQMIVADGNLPGSGSILCIKLMLSATK